MNESENKNLMTGDLDPSYVLIFSPLSDEKRGCVIVIIMHEVAAVTLDTFLRLKASISCAPCDTSIGLGIFFFHFIFNL